MNKENIMKWVKFISFGFLLLGGINWLLIGLFEFDLFGTLFGGVESVVARVFYSLFGIGAAIILTTVLVKAFSKDNEKKEVREAKAN